MLIRRNITDGDLAFAMMASIRRQANRNQANDTAPKKTKPLRSSAGQSRKSVG